MHVISTLQRVPETTDSMHLPILGRTEYIYVLQNNEDAKYCDASLRMIASKCGAQMYSKGNSLVLNTAGSNEKLFKMILDKIEAL